MNYTEDIRIIHDNLISRADAARYLNLKQHTLACWDSAGKNSEYFKRYKISNRVYYDFDLVKSFVREA